MNERPTPRTDAATFDVDILRGDCCVGRVAYPDGLGDYVTADLARDLERKADEMAEALEELASFAEGFSREKPTTSFEKMKRKARATLAKWKEKP